MSVILSKDLQKLKSSLNEAIQNWMNDEAETDTWSVLDTFVSDNITELMTDSAFNILLSQKDLSGYYKEQGMLND